MPPTTTDRDPVPTLVAPCADCGTTAGGRDHRSARPVRKRGLCRNCYARHDHLGDILDFPRVLFDLPHDVCLSCGPINPREYMGRGLCCACLHRARRRGLAAEYPLCGPRPVPRPDRRIQPAHPDPLPAVVTPAMLGITPGEIGKHYFTAQAQLWADEAACILAGAQWRQRHPEQFAPDHLARIFGGDATHAFWHEDAAAAA